MPGHGPERCLMVTSSVVVVVPGCVRGPADSSLSALASAKPSMPTTAASLTAMSASTSLCLDVRWDAHLIVLSGILTGSDTSSICVPLKYRTQVGVPTIVPGSILWLGVGFAFLRQVLFLTPLSLARSSQTAPS
ncbi:uncharacterized protein K452DRAFT_96534 [Aplosporella prunicola CBS 121167]|uniref:Uncharacterized protein n=1 Tax=Aplosporella prunicola CBS 121167 TaxID=1176127 RepID=A0A6A6B562_9PEZI|nr:uncharacterized protein K452DRAFT_96534 [Aplosporella prunicola CBS 121167]KAF2137891.1 hypothetical protein K452DRAFT_96534 [Aplosporella prunicola CBS 121167]